MDPEANERGTLPLVEVETGTGLNWRKEPYSSMSAHSGNKYLLLTYYVPGTFPGAQKKKKY